MKLHPNRAVSRLHSVGHALRGVWVLLSTQANARIHVLATVVVVVLGIWLRITAVEWAVFAAVIGMVFVAESLNTALEILTDLVSPQWHAMARDAKDVAAAAVLLSSLGALVAGGWIFLPRLYGMLGP